MGFPDNILWPLMVAVAWIMVQFHSLFSTIFGLEPESGLSWALSIVGLVVVIRILLIPLFVKQIKASRGMQLLAPDLQKIQKKYKGKTDPASREAMSRETMELYRKHGTNPFSSCLPILAQSPIFFALFRVLYQLTPLAEGRYGREAIGPLTQELATQANEATLFGAQISSFFLQEGATTQTRIVTVVLIFLMSATTFTTQRQLTQKNMPASALQGPMAQQQKMLLYLLPVIFAVSGVNFPIGVLIYWTTTNLWSMGQQFYVIRRNPTPGSEAERQLKERRAKKAAAKGIVLEEEKPAIEEKPRGQRQQPKRKERAKGTTPGTAAAGSEGSGQESGDVEASEASATDVTSSSEAPRSPSAGGASGTTKRPASGRSSTSSAGSAAKKPATGAAKKPATGAAKKPATGAAKKPAGGTSKPTTGGTTKPSSGGAKKPPTRPTT